MRPLVSERFPTALTCSKYALICIMYPFSIFQLSTDPTDISSRFRNRRCTQTYMKRSRYRRSYRWTVDVAMCTCIYMYSTRSYIESIMAGGFCHIYMCIYIYMCVLYIYVYAYIQVVICIYTYTYMFLYIYVYVYVLCSHLHICKFMYPILRMVVLAWHYPWLLHLLFFVASTLSFFGLAVLCMVLYLVPLGCLEEQRGASASRYICIHICMRIGFKMQTKYP